VAGLVQPSPARREDGGHAARVFKDTGRLNRRSRDEEGQPLGPPALKYRATVTAPLRGEEQAFLDRFSRDEEGQPLCPPALKYRATVTPRLRGEEQPFFRTLYATRAA
jgi:hypothetical protein